MIRKGESSRIEALEALIAEKRKHEGYLAKLDERREGTPEHVYSRLRDEYLLKLTDAQVKAQMEAESIAGGLTEDDEAVRELEARLATLEEEKVEGELRAAVGELDPKEWNKKLTALTASISLAEKERDARTEIVERTRALLAEALGSAGPGKPAPDARSKSSTGGAARSAGMSGGPSFDELAFLSSVTGRPEAKAGSAPPASGTAKSVTPARSAKPPVETASPASVPPKGATAPQSDPANAADAPETRARASTPTPSRESSGAPKSASEPAAKGDEPARAGKSQTRAPDVAESAAAAVASAPEEPDAFGRPTPRTSQAVKTLKCQECGTFNFPTEWYCERCGGELAAL